LFDRQKKNQYANKPLPKMNPYKTIVSYHILYLIRVKQGQNMKVKLNIKMVQPKRDSNLS